jgi:GT2 family glycosyltransferase
VTRLLDSRPWRAAELLVRVGREGRARLRAHRRQTDEGVAGLRRALADPARGDVETLAAALRFAVEQDGHDTAAPIAAELAARAGRLPAEALPALLGWLVATGDREQARAIAAMRISALEGSAAGAVVLDLLDLGGPRPVLPGGEPNAFTLARALRTGAIDGAEVLGLIGEPAWRMLLRPQLQLLASMAARRADPVAAERWLRRFLRSQALPDARMAAPATGHFLTGLRFTPGARAAGPLISVIIAAHRAAATAGFAIDSLLAQTHGDLEILVGDDASPDGTLDELVRRYGHDRRVRLFASARNQGAYNLRNQLVARARGQLLAFHDADDLALPERLEIQLRTLERSGAAACYSSWVRVTNAGDFIFFHDGSAVRLARASLLVGRDRFLALGGFRPARFGADLELHTRLADQGGAAVVRRPLIFSLWSESSATRQSDWAALEDGYRSPARRRYADLVFRRRHLGLPEADLVTQLRAAGNWADPADLTELG